MSKRHKGRGHSPAAMTPGSPRPVLPAAETERVRQLIAHGKVKFAVETAKELHKQHASRDSEALLGEAYVGRIRGLMEQGLLVEAKAMLEMVRERFPSARSPLEEVTAFMAARSGRLDELVRPLNDPALPADQRASIEDSLRRQMYDPAALARCGSLPETHPLRAGAAALAEAFQAVTSGPVEEEIMALPGISHRSPLAPWKMLVRALASWYRNDDAAAKRWVEAIVLDAAPARLIPVLQKLLGETPKAKLTSRAARLVAEVGSSREVLRPALAALDRALHEGTDKQVVQEIRRAVELCRKHEPALLERLKQHISVHCVLTEFPAEAARAAMGGSSKKDAYFFRLFARALETMQGAQHSPEAAQLWEDFRLQAIKEGWFPENGPEDAVLSLHMAELLERVDPDTLYAIQTQLQRSSHSQAKTHLVAVSPDKLYERACAADPSSEAFGQWLEWSKEQKDWRKADPVAELWHEARPSDVAPLLFLMESAEKRGAFQKALDYLEQAEQWDRVNPEVRKARLRLLISRVIRHLKQKKPHLAQEGVQQIAAQPEMRQGDRPAFLMALHWAIDVQRHDEQETAARKAEVERRLESPAAAFLLLDGLAKASGIFVLKGLDAPKMKAADRGALAVSVARACALGDDMGLPLTVPPDWHKILTTALTKAEIRLEPAPLRALGEAAVRRGDGELAYAATVAGLAGGGADARFLLLRAKALPVWEFERRAGCLAAALELARRQRDMGLVDEALEMARGRHRRAYFGFGGLLDEVQAFDFSRQPSLLEQILQEERAASRFPARFGATSRPAYARSLNEGPCQCPACRRQRGELDSGSDEDDFDDDELFLPAELGEMSPELLRAIADAIARGETPDQFIERVKRQGGLPSSFDFPIPPRRTMPRKNKGRAPSRGQEDLF